MFSELGYFWDTTDRFSSISESCDRHQQQVHISEELNSAGGRMVLLGNMERNMEPLRILAKDLEPRIRESVYGRWLRLLLERRNVRAAKTPRRGIRFLTKLTKAAIIERPAPSPSLAIGDGGAAAEQSGMTCYI